jgi:hypothetical protein
MSLSGAGVYNVNSAGQPVVTATTIDATVFNAYTADIATALSSAIFKDGQQTVTANIPFGGYKLTGVGAATALTDAATLLSIQNGVGVYVATVGGTADAITLTPSPAITAYVAGQTFRFISSGINTTTVTVAVSGLTAKAVKKNGTTALIAGDITSGKLIDVTYDGTNFQLGGGGDVTPYVDTYPVVVGSADATKKVRFEVDGLTTTTTRVLTVPDADMTIGYLNIPQNSQSAAYELVLLDSGKQIFHPAADTTARIWTIPANASVAFAVGTAVTFINETLGGVITIAITSDTLLFAGLGTTGSRTLAASNVATIVKITTTKWIISGSSGLT